MSAFHKGEHMKEDVKERIRQTWRKKKEPPHMILNEEYEEGDLPVEKVWTMPDKAVLKLKMEGPKDLKGLFNCYSRGKIEKSEDYDTTWTGEGNAQFFKKSPEKVIEVDDDI